MSDHDEPVNLTEAKPVDPAERRRQAEELVQRHMLYSMGAGLIPVPGVDVATGFGVQVLMLKRLSELYNVTFRDNLARTVIASLMATGGAAAGFAVAGSVIKSIPLIGTVVGVLGMPIMLGAYTFAVGKVFIAHFEEGGTLLNFDIKDYRKYWDEMVAAGKRRARKARADGETTTSETSGGAPA